MKNTILASFLLLIFTSAFSQNYKFAYQGRSTPSVKKETLDEARFLHEIMPEFCRYFELPWKDHLITRQLRLIYYSQGYYIQPEENYSQIIDYVSVEISAECNGKTASSQSSGDVLTTEQKSILRTADVGTDIRVIIKFRYKNQAYDKSDNGSKIKEGAYAVTVIPEQEAEYPGGFNHLTAYLTENVINKISEKGAIENIQQAIVKFTVNEAGQIVNAKISRTSSDPKTDKLLLDAIIKMPKWKPAKNLLGMPVKQEFIIPFGGGC